MPVSTPSYFPPNRTGDQIIGINAGLRYVGLRCFLAGQAAGNNSTVTDIIIIGDEAFSQGVTDQANLQGTIVIGSQACSSLLDGGYPGANTVIGFNALQALQYGSQNVVIGDNAFASAVSAAGAQSIENVFIGSSVARYNGGAGSGNPRAQAATVIGFQAAMSNNATNSFLSTCVIIGSNAAANVTGNIESSVIIGANTLAAATNLGGVVAIGCGTNQGFGATNCVFIGNGMTMSSGTEITAVGDQIVSCGTEYNVVIGDHASAGDSSHNVIIGSAAGINEADISNNLIIETGVSNAPPNYRLVYGAFGPIGAAQPTGLIFGDSSQALANEDIQGRNSVKIVNGAKGIANPIGGGYFYVLAGALHWVGSSGTDTVLAGA